jgi:hypothetical protein
MTVKEKREYELNKRKAAKKTAKNAKKVVSMLKKFNIDNAEISFDGLTLIPVSAREIKLYREIDKLMDDIDVKIAVEKALNCCEAEVMHCKEDISEELVAAERIVNPFAPHKRCIWIRAWRSCKEILGIRLA